MSDGDSIENLVSSLSEGVNKFLEEAKPITPKPPIKNVSKDDDDGKLCERCQRIVDKRELESYEQMMKIREKLREKPKRKAAKEAKQTDE